MNEVFRVMPVPGIVLQADSPRFTVADVNDAYLSLTGILRDEIIGKGFFEVFPEIKTAYTEILETSLQQVLEEKEPNQTPVIKYIPYRTNGTFAGERHYVITNVPLYDERNEVEFIVRTIADVTETDVGESEERSADSGQQGDAEQGQHALEFRTKFESLIQTVDGIIWEADIDTFQLLFISGQVQSILGYTPEQWLGEPGFWKNHIHPEDRVAIPELCTRAVMDGKNQTIVYRMIRADGEIVWIRDRVTIIHEYGKPVALRGLMIDITETKRLEDMEYLEKTVLELNSANEESLQQVLGRYLVGIENIFPQMKCSIIGIVDGRLRNWAAPSLPSGYIDAIENLRIGNNVGSCGTAAYLREKVIVSDIAHDRRWADYKDAALQFDLQACWSHPIMASDETVIATFAIYYNKVRSPSEDEIKIIDRAVSILQVMLENRQIHKDLLSSESRLRSLVDSQTNYVIRTDLRGNYTYYNNRYKQDFSWYYDYEDFIGSNCMMAVLPAHREHVMETVSLCVRRPGMIYQVEIDQVSTDERPRSTYWHFTALTDSLGQPVEIQCIGIDVTQRKKAEDDLRKSNERYELINKATNDAIYDWDLTVDHMHWGEGFFRVFGLKAEGIQSMEKWAEYIHPGDRDTLQNNLHSHLNDNKQNKWTAQYRFLKADGNYAVVEETGYIRRNRLGRAVRMVGVLRDITERIQYIDQIEQRNKKLEEIAWMQSHVIRAPLARVMGIVDLMKNYENTQDEQTELLEHLMASARSLDEIIRLISSKTERV